MARSTTKLGPFTVGIDNRAREHALPAGAVRDAVNVDLSQEGRFRRRRGSTRVLQGTTVHSLWSNGTRALFADGSTLFEMLAGGARRPLFDALTPNARLSYQEVPGRGIAFSDGYIIKRLLGDVVTPLAVAGPRHPPVVTLVGGSLDAGLYQVCCSFLNDLGEESGVVFTDQVQVPQSGAITLFLPRAVEPETTRIGIYLSPLNSEDVYLVETVPVAQDTFTISTLPITGRAPASMYTEVLPAGDALTCYGGRLYSHSNGVVRFTAPWSGQHHPLSDYLLFPEPVTILYATPGGVWIVADRTYWMTGHAGQENSLRVEASIRATRGTLVTWPEKTDAMWFTEEGLVLASEGGALQYLQQRHIAVAPATEGAAFYREQDGLKQVVATLRSPSTSNAIASSWFRASITSEEVRNEF